jgi:hypothetical protein
MASIFLQILSFTGALAALAFLAYGAWLCFTAHRAPPRRRAAERAAEPGKPARSPEGDAWV